MAPARTITEGNDVSVRWRAAVVSLAVAVLLLAAKYEAYVLTHSQAVLSDALESIVNVVAAAFAIGSLMFAGMPADRNHPYGHGKVEFFAAAFEGGMIAFAAVLILWEAGQALVLGAQPHELGIGTAIVAAAGAANCALGIFLVRIGRKHHSITLVADGKHVLSDFWTSVGVVVGLAVVWLTGIWWLDPLVAAVVALHLLWVGAGLVRKAAGGLLDEEDPELLAQIVQVVAPHIGEGVIRLHMLRAIRAGRYHHVSAHLVVPEFFSVERAHEIAEDLAAKVIKALAVEGELTFHTDPCHRAYCAMCDLEQCSVRTQAFTGRPALHVDEAVLPDRTPAK
jgi:cation diffusion facilitator family transporter